MSENNDIRPYNAGDFERYHSGKMTEQEMHALEKAALDDPFLSDALDGYMLTRTASADINELKGKLLQKNNNKKTAWFTGRTTINMLRIAALLVLITGAGLILYKNKSAKKNEIASVIDKPILPENKNINGLDTTADKQTETAVTVEAETQQQLTVSENKIQGQKKINEKIITNEADNFTINQAKDIPATDSVSQIKQQPDFAAAPIRETDVSNVLAGKVAGAEVRPQSGNKTVTIRGRVTDDKGNPVSFATVIDNKNKIGVQSDVQGTFAFPSRDSSPEVAINAMGYKTIIKQLNNDSAKNNLVMLEQDNNTLKEVIVTSAFQTERKKRSVSSPVPSSASNNNTQRVSVTNAIPVNGWQDFNKYVIDSLKILKQLGPSSVSAEVSVSFNVDNNGQPVEIKVRRSLCSSCDEEAERFLKNSPPWKLNKKRKKAMAIIRF